MIRLISVILFSQFLFANLAYAAEPYVPTENEEYYGTWYNEEYNNRSTWAKWEIKPNGKWASYGLKFMQIFQTAEGPYTIDDKWTDDNGDIWYKITWINDRSKGKGYGLIHISDSGSKMEAAYSPSDHPTKIDRTKPWWEYGGIHYRK